MFENLIQLEFVKFSYIILQTFAICLFFITQWAVNS
jgi:hypothetical protein